MEQCGFCNCGSNTKEEVLFENDFCVCLTQSEPTLVGSCVIIPKAHKESVFDLNDEEWGATKELIEKVMNTWIQNINPMDTMSVGTAVKSAANMGRFFILTYI